MNKYLRQTLDGRYDILEQIGVGGMSNVYKAYDLAEERIVAVKILKDEFSKSEEFIMRFKNESKAIAVLSHRNIVKVYDVNFLKNHQYIVMEYVDGITLKEYINQQGSVNWKEVIHFTTEILKALQHAHDKGIVHRDIKPQNIMILSSGNIKVMDFGIARFARSDSNKSPTEKTVGSVHYISPEQAQGNFTDQKTDIYSLGIAMYEMLSGVLPFEGESAVSVAIKQISKEPERLRQINPDVPIGLEDIVIKAMQKDTTKRYHTAAEMLLDINEFKKNPEVNFEYDSLIIQQDNVYYNKVVVRSKQISEKRKQVSGVARRSDRFEKSEEPISTGLPITFGIVIGFVISAIVGLIYFLIIKQPFARVPDITAPEFVGMNTEQAEELLNKNSEYKSLTLKIVEKSSSDEFGEGIIFKQQPKSGRKIKADSTIEISVSTGISEFLMPDLRNEKLTDAVQVLTKMNIKPKIERKDDPNIAEGLIISTSVEPNTKLEEGQEVILYVSSGEGDKKVTVPDLAGLESEKAAENILKNANLVLGTVTKVPSDKPPGSVVSQVEVAGSELMEGESVSIAISEGGGADSSYTLEVLLPYIQREVSIEIKMDESTIASYKIIPSEVSSVRHNINVENESIVEVFLDGSQLAVYMFIVDGSGVVSRETLIDNRISMNELG